MDWSTHGRHRQPQTAKASAVPDEQERSYEEIVDQLEQVLTELEDGGLPLDKAVAAYERGVTLSRQAQQLLSDAELRIDTLRDES